MDVKLSLALARARDSVAGPVRNLQVDSMPHCMYGPCMATTTISLTTEAYEKLSSLKQEGESFSDVIVKHYPHPLPRTCGELLEELEREFEGKRLSNPQRMEQVIAGRGRRSNRPSRR